MGGAFFFCFLKGRLTRDFWLLFFMNQFAQFPLSNPEGPLQIFTKIRYLQLYIYRRCRWNRQHMCKQYQQLIIAGVNDTGNSAMSSIPWHRQLIYRWLTAAIIDRFGNERLGKIHLYCKCIQKPNSLETKCRNNFWLHIYRQCCWHRCKWPQLGFQGRGEINLWRKCETENPVSGSLEKNNELNSSYRRLNKTREFYFGFPFL